MFVLGVLYIRTEAEPEGYNLSYSVSLKNIFCFNLHKKHCSEASRFKVGSSFNFSNLEVSQIISTTALF